MSPSIIRNSFLLFATLNTHCATPVLFRDYNILLVGRILGGIATSILFSAFEAWMVIFLRCCEVFSIAVVASDFGAQEEGI